MIEHDVVAPRASALLNSLRSVGYTLPTAVADIIDNSITAGASNIRLDAIWDGPSSYVRIQDDGTGMTEAELVEAMRLGTRNPLEERDASDLGRFGLGLKTASFSQCSKLTVSTRVGGKTATRCWDLDLVTARDEWVLLKRASQDSAHLIEVPGGEGTTVLWQGLRSGLHSARADDPKARDRFFEGLSVLKQHLAMVFHRFLAGPGKIAILFNGMPIVPWDPFIVQQSQSQPEEYLGRRGEEITVRPYVLPHVSKMSTKDHASASGMKGWNAQQGFYVYRNERLLVGGDWLGLGFQQEEHFKLARIAIDLPNNIDADWDIDIKKSVATPPEFLRDQLKRIAQATRKRAADVYRHRGRVLARTAGNPEVLWQRKVVGDHMHYIINRKYPLVADALAKGDTLVKTLLRLIEETVPVQTIFIDSTTRPDSHTLPFEGRPAREVVDAALLVRDSLVRSGVSPTSANARTLAMEPFSHYRDSIQAVFEQEES